MATRRSKRPGKAKQVEVSIAVGGLKAPTPEQIERLKALVKSQVLTWVKADLNDTGNIVVICNEDMSACKDE